jgi:hypothetical protein
MCNLCFESEEGAKGSAEGRGLTNEGGRGRETVVHDVLRRHLLVVVVVVVMLVLG